MLYWVFSMNSNHGHSMKPPDPAPLCPALELLVVSLAVLIVDPARGSREAWKNSPVYDVIWISTWFTQTTMQLDSSLHLAPELTKNATCRCWHSTAPLKVTSPAGTHRNPQGNEATGCTILPGLQSAYISRFIHNIWVTSSQCFIWNTLLFYLINNRLKY